MIGFIAFLLLLILGVLIYFVVLQQMHYHDFMSLRKPSVSTTDKKILYNMSDNCYQAQCGGYCQPNNGCCGGSNPNTCNRARCSASPFCNDSIIN